MNRPASGLVLWALLGCGSPPAAPVDAGLDAPEIDAFVPLVLCGEPDRACPDARPYPSAPCEGELVCDYRTYDANCVGGAWEVTPKCDLEGNCGLPFLLSEGCSPAFAGTLEGATVELGPPEVDRAFEEGERVPVIWGPRGYPMIRYAVRIRGVDATPECVAIRKEVMVEGAGSGAMGADVRLHCGMSRGSYAILPSPYPCESRDYPLTLTVTVTGVGAASAHLAAAGGGCPPGSL